MGIIITVLILLALVTNFYLHINKKNFFNKIECNVACTICNSGVSTDCSACAVTYYLDGTSCLQNSCPSGKYGNDNLN